jgi:hypothetical protein
MSIPGFENPVQGEDALSMAMDMLGEAIARAERAERQRNLLLQMWGTRLSDEGMQCMFLDDGTFVLEPVL